MSKAQVITEALKLSLEERAEVANLLLESLENPTLEEASQVWGEIAAERFQEMKADKRLEPTPKLFA